MTNRRALWPAVLLAAGLLLPAAVSAAEGGPERKLSRTVEEVTGYIVVTDQKADVTAAPEDRAEVLETAGKGDVYQLKGKQRGWYFVATGETTAGWIRSDAAAMIFYPEYFSPSAPPEAGASPAPGWMPPPGEMYGYPRGWSAPYRGWEGPGFWWPGWWGAPWFDFREHRSHGPWRRHFRDRDWR